MLVCVHALAHMPVCPPSSPAEGAPKVLQARPFPSQGQEPTLAFAAGLEDLAGAGAFPLLDFNALS